MKNLKEYIKIEIKECERQKKENEEMRFSDYDHKIVDYDSIQRFEDKKHTTKMFLLGKLSTLKDILEKLEEKRI